MATLAPASSEFVDALRRGLEAYDAGEIERASHLFDEALEIEPDNVWGLLWKGATAPSVGEAKMWLEQAIAIDAHNEHARAGLRWASEQLANGSEETLSLATLAGEEALVDEEAPPAYGAEDGVDNELAWLSEADTASDDEVADFTALLERTDAQPEMYESDEVQMAPPSEAADLVDQSVTFDEPQAALDEPQVTLDEPGGEDVTLPDWLVSDETATADAAADEQEELPDWLGAEATAGTEDAGGAEGQAAADLPDWLTADEPSGTLTAAADVDEARQGDAPAALPDWLTASDTLIQHGDVEAADAGGTDEGEIGAAVMDTDLSQPADLPDWLVDDVPSSAAATELPDWLTMEEAPDVTSAADGAQPDGAEVPDWLLSDSAVEAEPAAAEDSGLPDWLTGSDGAPAEADLPDWMTGGERTPAAAEADLPDWLTGAGEPAAQSADLPDWLAGTATAPASENVGELPAWLLGDDSTPFQAARGQGSLAPSDEVVEAYQAGLWAYEEDRLDDATRAFQRVIRLDPNHVEAHNYLGSVFYLNGRQDDAITALRRALELDPSHSESYLNLGLVYKETGRNSQAVQMFNRYLDLAPSDDTTTDYVRELIGELGG